MRLRITVDFTRGSTERLCLGMCPPRKAEPEAPERESSTDALVERAPGQRIGFTVDTGLEDVPEEWR